MSFVPAVTEITSRVATWDASGLIDAVRDHIFNDTTHLQIDAYTAGEGLTIGFVDAGESHQCNWRKGSAALIHNSVEPSGSITDPGDSVPTAPTGTGSDWSDERSGWDVSLGSPGAGSKLWIVECTDAFFVYYTATDNLTHKGGCHSGRIYVPFSSSDAAANGQDGLGFFAGLPDTLPGSANDWVGTVSPESAVHWSTGVWSSACTSDSSTFLAGGSLSYRPLPPETCVAYDSSTAALRGDVGPFKYVRRCPSSDTKTVFAASGSNQGWIVVHDSTSSGTHCYIWDKLVTP